MSQPWKRRDLLISVPIHPFYGILKATEQVVPRQLEVEDDLHVVFLELSLEPSIRRTARAPQRAPRGRKLRPLRKEEDGRGLAAEDVAKVLFKGHQRPIATFEFTEERRQVVGLPRQPMIASAAGPRAGTAACEARTSLRLICKGATTLR